MDVLSRPADEFVNDSTLEAMWAMKAYQYAEIHFNILCSADPAYLKLTPVDDIIYTSFRQIFPDLNVKLLDEDAMKSPEGKNAWRPFCEQFKELVEDYSFGTLLRLDATQDYSEVNSILVPRIQFYAIELARNREGANAPLRKQFKDARANNVINLQDPIE